MRGKKILLIGTVVAGILYAGYVQSKDRNQSSSTAYSQRSWFTEGPVYETHPYYYDGTFKGLTEKIPEIADLGVKTIYLIPIWESDQGDYRILDYAKIDPKYGTEKELKELVVTVHKYEMKIIFDLTTRVAAPGSIPWNDHLTIRIPLADLQTKARSLGWDLQYETDRQKRKIVYANRRYHANEKINAKNTRTKRICDLEGRIIAGEVILNTYPVASKGIAIDRTNPGTIAYFTKTAKFYVENYDIDGWRIDNPLYNWNPRVISGDHSIVPLLRSAKEAITKVKPEAVMLAENPWTTTPKDIPLDEMCEASYSYNFNDFIYTRILKGTVTSQRLGDFFKREKINYRRTRSRFLETHDLTRINKAAAQLHKPLAVLISTIPGIPMIQAGQEIRANEPFPNPVDWLQGDNELRVFYKKIFSIRNNSNALKYGDIKNVWQGGENICAYSRTEAKETVVVVINFSGKQSESVLNLPCEIGINVTDKLSNETFTVDKPSNFKITVPPYGARILVINK